MSATHPCGCNLVRSAQKPCSMGAVLWTKAEQAYARAVETGDWRAYTEAELGVYEHYGDKPWCSDAYVSNMEKDSYRRLLFAAVIQLERWIECGNEELAPHAIVEWGLRFAKDYPHTH